MILVGIDPGSSTGGIAAINEKGVPLKHDSFRTWKEYLEFIQIMVGLDKEFLVVLEKVSSNACRSAMAAFSFGGNYHGCKCLLETHEIPHIEVSPQTWQKEILPPFRNGQSKVAAYNYIIKRYPSLKWPNKKRAEGPIDAYCIAEFGRRQTLGK